MGAIAEALAAGAELKKSQCAGLHDKRKEGWCLHHPRTGTPEDPHKTSDKSWQKGNLRKDRQGQGQASKKDCESIPSGSFETKHLKQWLYCRCIILARVVFRRLPSGAAQTTSPLLS